MSTLEPGPAEPPREPERLCPHGQSADYHCEQCNPTEKCIECGKALEDALPDANDDGPYCSANCISNANERAYDRAHEDDHAGDGPLTLRERQLKEYEGERR